MLFLGLYLMPFVGLYLRPFLGLYLMPFLGLYLMPLLGRDVIAWIEKHAAFLLLHHRILAEVVFLQKPRPSL